MGSTSNHARARGQAEVPSALRVKRQARRGEQNRNVHTARPLCAHAPYCRGVLMERDAHQPGQYVREPMRTSPAHRDDDSGGSSGSPTAVTPPPPTPPSFLPSRMTAAGLVVLLSYIGIESFAVLLISWSTVDGKLPFNSSSVVLVVEVIKLIVSVFGLWQSGNDDSALPGAPTVGGLKELNRITVKSFLRYGVPSLIYAINNNLFLLVMTLISPAYFQLLLNSRVVWTGFAFRWLLNRRLTKQQWIASCVLLFGCALSQVPSHGAASASSSSDAGTVDMIFWSTCCGGHRSGCVCVGTQPARGGVPCLCNGRRADAAHCAVVELLTAWDVSLACFAVYSISLLVVLQLMTHACGRATGCVTRRWRELPLCVLKASKLRSAFLSSTAFLVVGYRRGCRAGCWR